MRPSLLTRLFWLLQDIWELSPLARLRWRVRALRHTHTGKVVGGALAALLVAAGFIAARTVARAPDIAPPKSAPRVITVHRRVRVLQRVGDRLAARGRLRTVVAHGRTVTQGPALRTVNAVRVVTTPGAAGSAETRTVVAPVTDTATQTSTRLVTVTQPVTVTRPITVVRTTTVVSIKTVSVPVTVTVTVP